MALGISFIPGQGPDQQQQQGPAPQNAPALQQALQMISLRVPRFTNANAITPPELQQRQPGQPLPPVPGTPEWEEMMRRLMGGNPPAQPGQPPNQPPPSTPGTVIKYPAPPSPQPPGPPPTPMPTWPGPGQPKIPGKPLPGGGTLYPDSQRMY